MRYVIGVDYGSDSCRALLVDAESGREIATSVSAYRRWTEGRYCDHATKSYRQHPLDYIESLTEVIAGVTAKLSPEELSAIEGLAFDCTSCTPAVVDASGTPLALLPGFEEDPDAMFMLWKDHSAEVEADEINRLSHAHTPDYTKYSSGNYSPEWVWAKVLHVLRRNEKVAAAAYSWVEHCDWMTGLMCGNTCPETMPRSRCVAGHKAMWNMEWGGLPPKEFFAELHPTLAEISARFSPVTLENGVCVGNLCPEWAARLGLPESVKVAVGSVDAHIGAVGAGIRPHVLTRIMGTSSCDMVVADISTPLVQGICGQVDGSILPGMEGFEAGQAAFGDVYAWFKRLLCWAQPADPDKILVRLGEEAALLPDDPDGPLALDWMNGRRSPFSDTRVKGMIYGISLGTTAPMIYKALVEATALGSRAISECYQDGGISIEAIRAVGGIASKSEFVMQTMCDAMGKELLVVSTQQACALGSAMCAATAAGIYSSLMEAQEGLASPISRVYTPNPSRKPYFDALYQRYLAAGAFFGKTSH